LAHDLDAGSDAEMRVRAHRKIDHDGWWWGAAGSGPNLDPRTACPCFHMVIRYS
jgi:hypothetical protein